MSKKSVQQIQVITPDGIRFGRHTIPFGTILSVAEYFESTKQFVTYFDGKPLAIDSATVKLLEADVR